MHKAFYPIRLIKNNHYEFESLSCYQNYLLLGTKSGLLLIYEVVPSTKSHSVVFIPPVEQNSEATGSTDTHREVSTPNIATIMNNNGVVPTAPLPSFNVRVCATHNLGKKRILQLQAVPEYGFFLALTELQLAAYRLSDRQLIAVVPNSKGASQFAIMYQSTTTSRLSGTPSSVGAASRISQLASRQGVYTEELISSDRRTPSSRQSPLHLNLCTCVRRKLFFFRWSPAHQNFISPSALVPEDPVVATWPSDFTLGEPARWVQFCGPEFLLVGLRSEYLRLNIRSRELVTITTPNKLSPTLATPLPYCLDAVNFTAQRYHPQASNASTSLEAETTGETTTFDDHGCSWTLGASAPFALASDESLLTLLPTTTSNPTTMKLEKPIFQWSGIPQCLQAYPPYILGGLTKRLEVRCLDPCCLVQSFAIPSVRAMCCNANGWLYATAAASTFADDLKPDLSCSQDLSSSSSSSTSTVTTGHGSDVWLLLSANRLNVIEELAQKKEFEMALKLARFTQLSAQSAIETHQLAALHAFHMFNVQRKFEDSLQLFYRLNTNPAQVLALSPDMLPETCSGEFNLPSKPNPLSKSEMEALAEPLIAYLVRWRNRLRSSQHQPPSSNQASPLVQPVNAEDPVNQTIVVCAHMMAVAGEATCRCPKAMLLQLVDTSLLKCYLVTNLARIGPLLRQENYCHLEEVERILTNKNCYEDLVIMYRLRGLHKKALTVLTEIATKDGNRCNAHDTSNSITDADTRDFRPIVEYLKQLADFPVDLVFEFADWILQGHPRSWISIFTAWEQEFRRALRCSKSTQGKPKTVWPSLSYREKVLRYLDRKAPLLIIPLLERIIFMSADDGDELEDEKINEPEVGSADDKTHLDERTLPCNESDSLHSSSPASSILPLSPITPKRISQQLSVKPSPSPVATRSFFQSPRTWEATCLWPFPRRSASALQSKLSPRRRRSHDDDDDAEDDDEGEDYDFLDFLPQTIEQIQGLPDPVELHNRYAKALVRQIQTLSKDSTTPAYRVTNEKPANGEVARLRTRLVHFLRHPHARFSAETLLPSLPYDACFEERALLLARLNRHEQALTIWVHLLDSWNEALTHCSRVQATHASEGERSSNCCPDKLNLPLSPDIYTILVEVCLTPLEPVALGIIPPTKQDIENGEDESLKKTELMDFRFKPRLDLAMEVMQSFTELVNAPKVLRMLPELVELKDLSTFVESTIKQQESVLARLVFFLGAARCESVQSRLACTAATAGKLFKVTPLSRCRQCRRRIGTSAFVRYPDTGELVHYGCCKDLPMMKNNSNNILNSKKSALKSGTPN